MAPRSARRPRRKKYLFGFDVISLSGLRDLRDLRGEDIFAQILRPDE